VAVGDFDGDTDPDPAVANVFSGNVSVLLGGAGGSFGAAANFAAGDFPRSVAVGDFDGDADPDLAVANFASDAVEDAVKGLLLDPLGLEHSRFFSDQIIGLNVAAPHLLVNGKPKVAPGAWAIERAGNPNGGLISSARDQLNYARFHLGDGRARDGKRVMSKGSLLAMRSRPGPGGTVIAELEGMAVSWILRLSVQGVRIVQHGGDVPGQRSGFMLVPQRDFAITVLTNSDGGIRLLNELFADDWALRRFAGLTNLPAHERKLSPRELAVYEGRYTSQELDPEGELTETAVELRDDRGQLRVVGPSGDTFARLAFYKRDHVLKLDHEGVPAGPRPDFIRDATGRTAWLRLGGRRFRNTS
jgi:hypothetical protein